MGFRAHLASNHVSFEHSTLPRITPETDMFGGKNEPWRGAMLPQCCYSKAGDSVIDCRRGTIPAKRVYNSQTETRPTKRNGQASSALEAMTTAPANTDTWSTAKVLISFYYVLLCKCLDTHALVSS